MDTAAALDRTPTDRINMGLIAKQGHWNVTGPSFRSLHAVLDELADLARDAGDGVDERAITLGQHPDGRPEAVAAANSLPALGPGPLPDQSVVSGFVAVLDFVIPRPHDVLECLDDDRVTEDLLIGILGPLGRQAGMLRAQRP